MNGAIINEIPVIFDFACNFMRFNEKLKNMFEISEGQKKFKELYEDCLSRSPSKVKTSDDEIIKPCIISRTLGVLEALSKYNIDISQITKETKWEDIEKRIPEQDKEKVLDRIYTYTGMRIEKDYKFGLYLTSARNAFWHVTTENSKTSGTKKYFNSATDNFFKTQSMGYLFRINFFKDFKEIENIYHNSIDSYGFIVDNCADLDYFYGFNIYTGTKYSKAEEISPDGSNIEEALSFDVNGFTPNHYNVVTHTTYDTRFFRFDSKTGSWVNLHTNKDEDLLGYNHDGIRVNSKYGALGFDRRGFWHKKLPDGTYSKEYQEYDDTGKDVLRFRKNSFFNGLWNKYKNGVYAYGKMSPNMPNSRQDNEGYDIYGNDQRGFNRDGIHRVTGTKYNQEGYTKYLKDVIPIVHALKTSDQKKITEFIILNSIFKLENTRWFKNTSISMEQIYSASEEILTGEKLKHEIIQNHSRKINEEIEHETKKKTDLEYMYSRLLSVLQNLPHNTRESEKEEER